jgi:FAD/FMN-containing dehydrogenase
MVWRFGRRALLGTAVAVVGFNVSDRTWVSAGSACPSFDDVPALDGSLLLDSASLGARSADNGHLVDRTPCAVLLPGSVADVARMMRYCRDRGIPVAARGQAHTTQGQALVRGLVVDMRSLATVHSIGSASADVDAGALWTSVVEAAGAVGLTPPVLTRYTGLSVGGTLSVGGVGVRPSFGAQVDNALELEVVTGDGRIRWCSPTRESSLFFSVLGGLGQYGVITRARVALVPAPSFVRTYALPYASQGAFFRELRMLRSRAGVDGLYAGWVPGASGLTPVLNVLAFYSQASPPDDSALLRGVSVQPVVSDAPYLSWVRQVDAGLDKLRREIDWDALVKPYFAVFLGDRSVERFAASVVPGLSRSDVGPGGSLLMLMLRGSALTRPMLRVPDSAWVFMFSILTTSSSPGPNPAFAAEMLERNGRLYSRARELGGTQYPIGSLPLRKPDWIAHYGRRWPSAVLHKRRYDPAGILTPGPGIF